MKKSTEIALVPVFIVIGFFLPLGLMQLVEVVGEKQYRDLGGRTHSVPTEEGCTIHFDCVDSGECRAPRVECPAAKHTRPPWPEVL